MNDRDRIQRARRCLAEAEALLADAGVDLPEMAPLTNCVPMQPIVLDPHGRPRFRQNALVRYLLDQPGGQTLNDLARLPNIPMEDWAQLAQLIGYSVSGYGELSYALNVEEANAVAAALLEKP